MVTFTTLFFGSIGLITGLKVDTGVEGFTRKVEGVEDKNGRCVDFF